MPASCEVERVMTEIQTVDEGKRLVPSNKTDITILLYFIVFISAITSDDSLKNNSLYIYCIIFYVFSYTTIVFLFLFFFFPSPQTKLQTKAVSYRRGNTKNPTLYYYYYYYLFIYFSRMDATVSVGKQESLPFGVFSGNYGQDETPSKAALFMQRIRREDSINEDYDDEQEELIKTVRQEPREIPLSPISDVCVVEETEEGLFSTVRRLDPKLMSSVFDNSQPSPSSISDAATPKKRTSLGRSPRRSSGATTPMSSKRRRSSLLRRRSSDKSQSRRSSLQLDGYEEGELEKSNHTDKDDVNSVRTTPSRSGRRSSDAQKTFKPAVSPQKRSSEGGKRSSVETTGNESVGRKRSSIEHSLTVDGIHKSPKTGGKASRRWSAVRKITLSDDVDNQRRSSLLQIPSNERRITTPTRNLGSVVTLMMKQERETKEFSDQMSDLRERLTTNRTRLQSLKGKPDEVDTIEERVNLISKIHEDEVLETQLLEDFDNFKKQSLTTDEDQRIWRGFLASKAIRREHTEQKEEAKRVQEVRSKETIKFKLRHEKEQNIKLSTKEKMKQIEQIESKRSEEEQELKAKMNELKQQYQEQQKKVSALEIGSATQYEYVVEKGVLNTIDIAQLELKKQIETLPERFITPTLTPEEERAARGLQAFQAARQLRLSQVSEAKRLQGAKEESKKLAGAAATKQRLAEIEDIRKSLTTKTEFLKFTEEHYYHSRDILIERRDFAESSLTSIELIVNSQQKQLSVFYIPTVLQTKLMETSLSFCNEVSKLNDEIENLSILHAADAQIAQLTPTERIEQRAQRGVKRKSKDTITSPTLGPNTGTAFNPPPSPLLGALDVSNVTTLLSSLRNRNAVSQAGVTAPQIKKQTQQQPTSTTIRKLSLSELHPVDQITELKGHILGESITLSNSGEQLFYEISEADSEIAKLVEEVKRIEIDIEMLSQTSHVAITLCASMALEIINDVEKQRRERELLEKESSASPACSSATFSFQVTEEVASVGASSPQGSFRSTIRTSKLLVGDSYNNHPLSGSNKSSLASLTPPPSDAQLAAAICILIHTTCDSNNCYHSTHSISVLNTTTAEDVATALLYLTPSLGNPTVLPPSTVVSPSTTIRCMCF